MLEIVDEIRGFNRFYTRVLGLLRPDLAGSAFGLTEARVMFELTRGEHVSASDLRRELDLDAGYLSRILSTFTTAGLVVRERSGGDGRRQILRLTAKGKREFAELDRLQAKAIDAMLAPLDDGKRQELVTSMGRIRRALGSGSTSVVLRPPEPGDLGWVVERHGARYAAEYGWDVTFESLAARVVADIAERSGTGRKAGWIAELDGTRVGCVFCTTAEEADTAQPRLLLVEPSARRLRRGNEARGRVSALRQTVGLHANHIVDQRCPARRPRSARRFSMRSPRTSPQLRTRPRRRVLVAGRLKRVLQSSCLQRGQPRTTESWYTLASAAMRGQWTLYWFTRLMGRSGPCSVTTSCSARNGPKPTSAEQRVPAQPSDEEDVARRRPHHDGARLGGQ